MNENDARKKWCPFTRMVFGYEQGTTQPFNRFMCEKGEDMDKMQKAMNGTMGTKCITSDCMMWVEEYEDVGDKMVPALSIGGHCGLIK